MEEAIFAIAKPYTCHLETIVKFYDESKIEIIVSTNEELGQLLGQLLDENSTNKMISIEQYKEIESIISFSPVKRLIYSYADLNDYVIEGVDTLIPLHLRLANNPDVINANFDIHFLERIAEKYG